MLASVILLVNAVRGNDPDAVASISSRLCSRSAAHRRTALVIMAEFLAGIIDAGPEGAQAFDDWAAALMGGPR